MHEPQVTRTRLATWVDPNWHLGTVVVERATRFAHHLMLAVACLPLLCGAQEANQVSPLTCTHGVHKAPEGPFAPYVFCGDALGNAASTRSRNANSAGRACAP